MATLADLLPLVAIRLELSAAYALSRDLLRAYLGRNAARRVLAGQVRRGQGTYIRAAIWYADLHDFTMMADRLPANQLIVLLNGFFDHMTSPVQAHGGDVLKYTGDGVLAIFPVDGDDPKPACRRALDAAHEAFARLANANHARLADGLLPLHAGLALHFGHIMFGNVGGSGRFDFTVIGSAVNEAIRMEALCRNLDRPVLVSAKLAQCASDERLEPLGRHRLRGVGAAQELWAVRDIARGQNEPQYRRSCPGLGPIQIGTDRL